MRRWKDLYNYKDLYFFLSKKGPFYYWNKQKIFTNPAPWNMDSGIDLVSKTKKLKVWPIEKDRGAWEWPSLSAWVLDHENKQYITINGCAWKNKQQRKNKTHKEPQHSIYKWTQPRPWSYCFPTKFLDLLPHVRTLPCSHILPVEYAKRVEHALHMAEVIFGFMLEFSHGDMDEIHISLSLSRSWNKRV